MLQLITILNRCHRFRGFVYQQARFSSDHKSIEIAVRPRKGSAAVCSRCHQPAPGYDQLAERRFEFIPFLGVSGLPAVRHAARRLPPLRAVWSSRKFPGATASAQLTNAYMLFLARWARRLSWKETAEAFRTSWDKVFDAVEHVVTFGLEHRVLGQIDAIGVDEIQYAKGHKYLTLVYQIDLGVTRLLWVGKERTIESFQGFFTTSATKSLEDRLRLLRHVGTLSEGHPREMLRGAAYPRPFPHRGENEQGSRRSPRRRIAPHGERRRTPC
jgi:transposase